MDNKDDVKPTPQVSFEGAQIHGSQFFIGSTLTNVTFNQVSSASSDQKAELERLKQDLLTELKKVPESHLEQAQAVEGYTKQLAEQASVEKPNNTMLKITGEGLIAAAKTLATITPNVLLIATSIVKLITGV